MSALFPRGIDTVTDLPYQLHEAIVLGLQFLRFEEMDDPEERPPRAIWLDERRLKAHFDAVEKRREEKYGGKDGKPREIEDPVQNDAARLLIAEE